jgi:Flp pilus assembly protein TadG
MIKNCRRSRSGAVYVEFLIAIMPMLMLFWGLMQLNGLLLADLVTRHAAVNAVRAAIVCGSQAKDMGGNAHAKNDAELGSTGGCAYEAAKKSLSAVHSFGDPPVFAVKVEGAKKSGNAPVTATVVAAYHCRVPLVGGLVCGLFTAGTDAMNIRFLSRAATLPNQGATYDM